MKKIAVIEDNPDNLLLMETILRDEYDVFGYRSGREALAAIREERPDLVLLDISLPDVDGVVLLGEIRAAQELALLPVIAVTAHALPGQKERFLSQGFDDYLSKPITDLASLHSTIERHLK